jgi:hypothetical protein
MAYLTFLSEFTNKVSLLREGKRLKMEIGGFENL